MNKANLAYVGGIVRILMAWLGGYLVQKGWVAEADVEGYVGAGVLLVTGVWSVWAKRKALLAVPPPKLGLFLLLLLPALFLCGCAAVYTPKISAISWGLDSSQVLSGLNVTRYQTAGTNDFYEIILDSSTGQQSSVKAIDGLIAIGEIVARARGSAAAPAASSPALDETDESVAPTEEEASGDVAYSSDGYGGSPGSGGAGVYGKPSCSRCRAYRSAHPVVEMINIEASDGNRAAMWSALRARGYAGSSVSLPVLIDAAGFIQAAR